MLKSTVYDQAYYEEHKADGLDYLAYGYWQESYARMVTEATLQYTYDAPFVVDAGSACGTQLNGFRQTGAYARIFGVDITEHMVRLGRTHFQFGNHELVAGSLTDIHVETGSVSLLHSHQVLEHIPDEFTEQVMREFDRILRPGGRAFIVLDAVRDGETKEQYMGDPTHVNIQPISYWTRLFQKHGLFFDVEAYNRFVRSGYGPTMGNPTTFFKEYNYWSVWTLIKPFESKIDARGWSKHPWQRWQFRRRSQANP
ncbi:SAM-dependent methyltransferase [Ensifer sp. WSM1721]|uniref:class I SAM-dependent methyltransferase n=1 Tax=Ensifer sp. WSM1721 TaxID=1041159 RepID=UPI000A0045C7|nr:class I SAM-dependent methyltransferase [Ensifer sp. WSM1721]